jgi:hypothetical protein
VTAEAALSALLKEHRLTMVSNSATTGMRMAPANLSVQPVSRDMKVRVANTGDPSRLREMGDEARAEILPRPLRRAPAV